jgi:hypothetical protein
MARNQCAHLRGVELSATIGSADASPSKKKSRQLSCLTYTNLGSVLHVSNDASQAINKILNPTIFTSHRLYSQFHLLFVRWRNEGRCDLLLVNHHVEVPSS